MDDVTRDLPATKAAGRRGRRALEAKQLRDPVQGTNIYDSLGQPKLLVRFQSLHFTMPSHPTSAKAKVNITDLRIFQRIIFRRRTCKLYNVIVQLNINVRWSSTREDV